MVLNNIRFKNHLIFNMQNYKIILLFRNMKTYILFEIGIVHQINIL